MNCIKALGLKLSGLVLLTGLSAPLHGQTPVSTFEELRSGLTFKKNDVIQITDDSGRKISARVAAFSAETLTVKANGVQHEFKESQVREISRPKPDSLKNGMFLGLGAGAGAGLVATAMTCPNDPECSANAGPILVLVFMGGGLGVGALVDSMIHKNETIFARRGSESKVTLMAAPILGRQTKGAQVSFRF